MPKADRPRQPRRITGKWLALAMAIAVQLGFLAVLIFSVSWQNRKPEAVTAELYAPPVKAPPAAPPPVPTPPAEPKVEPRPEPKVEPKAEPKAEPKLPPKVDKPDPHAADIALKAKQEEERKKRAEAEKREAEKKLREQKEAEDKRKVDDKRKLDDKRKQEEQRLAEVRERQQRETEALRALADREAQARAQAERDAQAKARETAERTASSKAEGDWIRRIQAKVKGNVIVPADLAGNPEAIFDVVQLPTGEIIDATLRKSSGNRAYDDAVQRAIIKSSPLPRPERSEHFQRTLTLKFRPQD